MICHGVYNRLYSISKFITIQICYKVHLNIQTIIICFRDFAGKYDFTILIGKINFGRKIQFWDFGVKTRFCDFDGKLDFEIFARFCDFGGNFDFVILGKTWFCDFGGKLIMRFWRKIRFCNFSKKIDFKNIFLILIEIKWQNFINSNFLWLLSRQCPYSPNPLMPIIQ